MIKQDGYHIDNRSIAVTLRNQPFTPYTSANGTKIELYFNFRIKGSYGASWDYYPFAENGITTQVYGGFFWSNHTSSPAPELTQSNSEYTTITFIPGAYRVPTGAQIDVQAQTMTGYMTYHDKVYVFSGETSGWSSTKTVTIDDSQPTPTSSAPTQASSTQNQTSTAPSTNQQQPNTESGVLLGLDWEKIAIIVLAIAVTALAIFVFWQRKKGGRTVES
ncbi:MAG: hypothetical protein M1540_03635 [Candidatus Bathyarchaeota archaeon]|nr:hypothetical protein [Candidatus Bathyarchaeota archaeon]